MLSAILPADSNSLLRRALYFVGSGLQFASIVALTVFFGLGLGATIHFLNRLGWNTNRIYPPASAWSVQRVLVGPA